MGSFQILAFLLLMVVVCINAKPYPSLSEADEPERAARYYHGGWGGHNQYGGYGSGYGSRYGSGYYGSGYGSGYYGSGYGGYGHYGHYGGYGHGHY